MIQFAFVAGVLIGFMGFCGCHNRASQSEAVISKAGDIASRPNDLAPRAAVPMPRRVRTIFQDRAGNLWFGTDGEGAFRYDARSLIQITEADGLCSNFIQSIAEDRIGDLWFKTRDGVCRRDGNSFTSFADAFGLRSQDHPSKVWRSEPGDLWIGAAGGVYRYDGSLLTHLRFPEADDRTFSQSPYSVYTVLVDRSGDLWLGTQNHGVARYRGQSRPGAPAGFTWFTDNGLSDGAVRSIFEDRHGNFWFGNNIGGVYRYDGRTVVNLTDEKGLGNREFARTQQGKPGTLARVWTIAEDAAGNLWFGSFDAGAWRYDGKNLINYTTKDGLGSNGVVTIFKDRSGNLWFGTDGAGVYRFDGNAFIEWKAR